MAREAATRPLLPRRQFLQGTGALVVGFSLAGVLPERARAEGGVVPLSPPRDANIKAVDGFLEIRPDGRVLLFSGKVDLGQGLPTALRQMAAEELGVAFDAVEIVTGDTALTPDQGATGGSQGVKTGGMQIRRAAATARQALLQLGAQHLKAAGAELETVDGWVRRRSDPAQRVSYGALIGDHRFDIAVDDKVALKNSADFAIIGQPVPRGDIPEKVTGRFTYVQDLRIPGMLHGRTIRPPAVGAALVSVDDATIKTVPGQPRVVRLKDFLAVVAESEWAAISGARALKAEWSKPAPLPEQEKLYETVRTT
ncbi:MAG: molybdopterin-dependent oxidoreductase, partial [Alphaproteobacteria bacterium]|nr:molybdopterin-dependent oxidoreductase [Alphaproteobacteria bacterium]